MTGELDRRTVLQGAAWSVPVVALAVGTPLAAASGARVTVDFAAAFIALRTSDIVTGVIAITNTSGQAISGETLSIVLAAEPTPESDDVDPSQSFLVTLPTASEAETSNGELGDVVNDDFAFSTNFAGSSLNLTGPLTVGAGGTVVIALYFRWAAVNPRRAAFLIAGSFTIGGQTTPLGSALQVTVEPPVE
ncbi:hypothetical protein SCB71_15860 [Herbiconiux sp. KACC 21604]|uniref:hypothetical protein n=1 Tax=unclassified Herbiconiux TaxID=2618217 RepID=UPI001491DB50|nr:hypothetical protein [Herbiconiux sp. SALV-R1]QJU54595.1 hypothetical protein HL652_13810 [Herbiconiux sp. SALV-R1]WPO85681.1 hypothetical protein SCB71_15860 [Herbiconiux sp. KACC 21604]